MSDFKINDYLLTQEAESLAKEAIENNSDDWDDVEQWIQETVDSHEYVIYYYKALQICSNCNTDAGEQMIDDEGGFPTGYSFAELACMVVYWELYTRTIDAARELFEEQEAA